MELVPRKQVRRRRRRGREARDCARREFVLPARGKCCFLVGTISAAEGKDFELG